MKWPSISIVIACKNAKMPLMETLENLNKQQYPAWEVIIVDGGSTDGTPAYLAKQQYAFVTRWCSESDSGISEAFNKGLALAQGEYINFQGAGDTLFSATTLQEAFRALPPDIELLCGRVRRLAETGQTVLWDSPRHPTVFRRHSLLFKMSLPHQALFTHRRFFERYGTFDHTVRFAMDYEMLLRAYHDFPTVKLTDQIISHWRAGGVGTCRIEQIFDEYHAIKVRHRVASCRVLESIDCFNRIKYKIKQRVGWGI